MPCLSVQESDLVDEHEECGTNHAKAPMASVLACRTSSHFQTMAAVKTLLQGIGEDVEREGLLKTPLRVASAFQSATAGYQLLAKDIIGGALFSEAGAGGGTGCGGGSGGMVVVRNIDTFALCDTCLLPFRLRCHVAYIPSKHRVVGLSKLPRVVEIFAKRLQNPQKFANQLVQEINDSFEPLGVGAAVESWHLQWPSVCDSNGASAGGTDKRLGFGWVPKSVHAAKGQLENVHCSLWDEFLAILQLEGVDIRRPAPGATDALPGIKKSCPFYAYDASWVGSSDSPHENDNDGFSVIEQLTNGAVLKRSFAAAVAAMTQAVESILRAVGENTSCEELQLMASRYVNWLLAATEGSSQKLVNGLDQGLNGTVNGASVPSHCNGGSCRSNGSLSNCSLSDHGMNDIVKGSCVQSHGSGLHNQNGVSASVQGVQKYCNGSMNRASMNHGSNGSVNGLHSNGVQSNGSVIFVPALAFVADDHTEGLVRLELEAPFTSLCEHHLLPFFGLVHLGYVGGRPIDRSVIQRVVRMFSRRLQVQERLTRQIAEAVASLADFQGVMVVVEASHMCIMSRGVEKLGSTTATVATMGQFSSDGVMRAAFLKKISLKATKRSTS